jgi:PAS domain S-box-containing protein
MKTEMHEQIDKKRSKEILDRITIICTVLTIIICTIILASWLFNLVDITRSNTIYKPMSPSSALSFIVLGCALLVYYYTPVDHTARKLAKVGVGLVLASDLIILVDYITGYGFDIEKFILSQPEIVNNVIIGRMSPIAAVYFVISSLALLLLLFSQEGKKQAKSIAAYLAFVSFYIGIIVFIGYLYETPLFYGATTIPTSLSTAISFIFLSVALLTCTGMEYPPLRLFIGDSVRARLMRSFIPVIIAYILLKGILKIVLLAYSDEIIESTIMVIFFFIVGGLITSRIAQTVGGDVDRQELIQRERAACALRESELKFRTIFETVPEGLGLARLKDGMLINFNNGLSHMFGYSKDEVVGKTDQELNFWVDPDDRKKMIEQLQSRGFVYGMEVKYRKKNGEIFTGAYSAAKLMINNEPHLIISTTDISQRKVAETERVKLIEKEHEARAEAEAARKLDRMKSIFIASTSHELRTPLNSVIGFSSILIEGYSGQLNPEQKEQLEIVHTSGKHLLTLINDILDISQIEAGNIKVEICEFKLGPIVDQAVSMLRVSLSEKKLDMKVNVQDIVMKSDRKRLFQCIVNLLSNAIKYTEKGSVEITVKVINNNAIIMVIDTGIGIETEDIPKLFDPFVRLQTPLTYKTSGTGLGLYLVKKLAKDFLGGDVEVKSEFGKGSTFTMRVPVEFEGKA